jgi:hypothetical protein
LNPRTIMNVEYLLPIVCFWRTISTEISKHKENSPAITNNFVSFIHCISYLVHYNYDYNLDYAVHMSIGFYIYDLIYIFSNLDRKQTPFILHHIAGICILNTALTSDANQQYILYSYNILEKSNIMIYISYYLHKQYAEYVRLNIISNFMQLLVYSYFRLIQLPLYFYNNKGLVYQLHFTTQLFMVAIYSMGLVWSHRLLKRNIANFYIARSSTRSMKYSSAG